MPPRGYGRKPPTDDQPMLAASGKELLEAAMTANSADDQFSFAPIENEDVGDRSDGSEHGFFQPATPSRRNITDLNFSPVEESFGKDSSAMVEGEEETSEDAQIETEGPVEQPVTEANDAGRAGVTTTEFEEDVDTEEEDVCGMDENGEGENDSETEAGAFEEDVDENAEGAAVTAEENGANKEDAEEMAVDEEECAREDKTFDEAATEESQKDSAEEAGASKQGPEEDDDSDKPVETAEKDLDATPENAQDEIAKEVARESDEEEETCSEDILDIVQECLTELGSEILKMTVKQIIAKVESSSGTDLSEWKKSIKKIITSHASSLYSQPDASSHEATPEKEGAAGGENEASDAEVDAKEDEEGAGSEYDDEEDDSENEGKAKGRMKKHGAKKATGKPSKATLEELEAVKEEEEVRAKNQAMVEMLQGDAQERKEHTNARLAALREKIRLKCSDEQAKRLNRAAAQLKTIKAAERNSPDSAAGFCAQAFSREAPKKVLPAARAAPTKKWGGLSHSPKKPDRRALRARLQKQRVYKAGEFFTQTNDDTGMTSEKYLMMLKEDDLQKQVKIKAALERKAQEAQEDIFAYEDEMSDGNQADEGSDDDDDDEDGRANAGVQTADASEDSSGEDAEDEKDSESAKPALPEDEEDAAGGSEDQGADDDAMVDDVESEVSPSTLEEAPVDETTPVEKEASVEEIEAPSQAADDDDVSPPVHDAAAAEAAVVAPVVAPAPTAAVPAAATVSKQRLDASGALTKAPQQLGIMAAFFNKPRKAVEVPKESAENPRATVTQEATSVEEEEARDNDTELDETAPDAMNGGEDGVDEKDANQGEEDEEEEEGKAPVDRAAAYKAELEREAKALKAGRRARKGGLLDEEAEEEEEEAEVAGLGDFGFAVAPKASGANGGDEDEKVVADEDDFENIVDDLSDGEGDEEAGKRARALKNASEDQNDLQEMKRRLKEGNLGGRRGGRQGARGNFREDQLMEIDMQGKKDLRKVGLTTASDDEGDESGGEGGLNSEDELDQAIKARHGRQESRFDDEGSDDDDDNEYANDGSAFSAAVALDDEAREERDAARAARRWEKQVKMRRVLSEVGGDRSQGVHDEESQSMLSMLKRSISNPTPKGPSKLMRQSSFSAGGAGSAPGSLPLGLLGAAPSAADAAMARRMAAPLSIRPFPGAAHSLGSRKGSFVDKKKRIVPTTAGGRTGTVSNQRFVFGAANVPQNNDNDSQSQSGNAWSEHLKRQAPAQGAQEVARKGTMNTAVYSFLSTNRFKQAKGS